MRINQKKSVKLVAVLERYMEEVGFELCVIHVLKSLKMENVLGKMTGMNKRKENICYILELCF
jgi:stage V sporulation protein SpoVS